MSKNILSELDAIIGGVIRPVFAMSVNVFVVLAITILLFLINPWLAFLVGIILWALPISFFIC